MTTPQNTETQDFSNSSTSTDGSSPLKSSRGAAHDSWISAATAASSASSNSDLPPSSLTRSNVQNSDSPSAEVQSQLIAESNNPSTLKLKSDPVRDQASAYGVMEISRMDQAKQQAMEALHHIERGRSGHANLVSPKSIIPQSQARTQIQDSASILAYIQDLEKKVASLQANSAEPLEGSQDAEVGNDREPAREHPT